MPSPSKQIQSLTPGGDDGWGLFNRARALVAEGVEVLELTIGEHDERTDPAILEEMHRTALSGHTGYAAISGTSALREKIAVRMTETTPGLTFGPENILVTPGGQSALCAAHMLACDPGDKAAMIAPYYATYPGTIRTANAVPSIAMARPENGFQPKSEDLVPAVTGATSLMINSPNNPTGAVYSPDTLSTIAAVAEAHDLWIISDEVYDTQVWEGSHHRFASLPGMSDRTLTVCSLSKSHAMTGSRLGWIAGPEAAIEALTNLATHTTYGVPGYIQDAGLFALNQGPSLEARVAAPFRRRRDIVLAQLGKQNVLRVIPPAGAMYVMLDVRATGLSGEAFAERLLDEERVAVMPGESFGEAAAGHVRVALTLPDALFEEAFGRLVNFANRLVEHAA